MSANMAVMVVCVTQSHDNGSSKLERKSSIKVRSYRSRGVYIKRICKTASGVYSPTPFCWCMVHASNTSQKLICRWKSVVSKSDRACGLEYT